MSRSILIVEDDALIAADLDEILENAGYLVVGIASTMRAALGIAARSAVDAAIMDINLADGASGVETAGRLREQHDVGCLFVSAQITDEVKATTHKWRPLGFVDKPYAANTIIRALSGSA